MSDQRWYVVAYRQYWSGNEPSPVDNVWTVSKDPEHTGWETDSGTYGYGLTRADAEFLANAANEKLDREENIRLDE